MVVSTAWLVPHCSAIGIGCSARGRGAELGAQVFPSVFEEGTMGLWLEIQLPLAKMAVMVGLGNAANSM